MKELWKPSAEKSGVSIFKRDIPEIYTKLEDISWNFWKILNKFNQF